MRSVDLQTFAEMGRAFWANPSEADPILMETWSAAALLESGEERIVDKAAAALLERATRVGMASNLGGNLREAGAAQDPFFRMLPEERLLLIALHLGRWSYARVAGILKESPEKIEQLAWNTRLELASRAKKGQNSRDFWMYPIGSRNRTPHCPDYDARKPWTQRFLDEEVASGTQRVFLQNHLMACDTCRLALNRCRDLYYRVDSMIPRLDPAADDRGLLDSLAKLYRESYTLRHPSERSFGESLGIFFRRTDVFWVSAGLVFIFALKILS